MADNKRHQKSLSGGIVWGGRALWSAALFLVFFFLVLPPVSVAQESLGITVTPVFQEVTLKEKDDATFEIAVTNTSAVLLESALSVIDFGSLDESGGVAFLGGTTELEKKYGLASWMRPETDTLVLGPGETKKVAVRIENRQSLSPGGHYGAVVFRLGEKRGAPDSQIAINQIFSVLVFVKKVGGERYDLTLEGVEPEHSRLQLPETVRLRFQNQGNVHVVPRGTVTVADPLGRVVAKGIINEESGIILPETFRVYPTRLSKISSLLLPGRYTLSVAYRYDGQEEFTMANSQFHYVFTPALVGGLLVIAGIGWYVIKQHRRALTKKEALPKTG